jgi:hypothetical protein
MLKTNVTFNMTKVAIMKSIYLLLSLFLLTYLISCKKDSTSPTTNVSIIGKWLKTKQNSALFNSGVQIATFVRTNYTADDFVQYFSDGTGYTSKSTATSPSLSEFNYTVNGKNITLFTTVDKTGTPGTITNLSKTNLSIHAESSIIDPNNLNLVDNEIDDFYYTKAN